MEDSKAKDLIIKLTNEINEHNYKYYCLAAPTISDYEFDKLLKQLKALETKFPKYKLENSPTSIVASDLTSTFSSEKHLFPMLSLSNTYSQEDVLQFDARIKSFLKSTQDVEYVCELKFDGVSINLVYENYSLSKAITRGDGQKGEDVTNNIKTIYSIPHNIVNRKGAPKLFEVKGEIFIHKKAFEQINKNRKIQGQSLFANPRNLSAGSIKLLDVNEVRKRPLDMFCYSLYSNEALPKTQYERLEMLNQWGFNVSKNTKICKGINSVMSFIESYREAKNQLSFEIDGIVIKVNDISLQNKLGATAKSPRWAVAYKYNAQSVETQILDINFQVGRTGVITPVALLKPILLSGTVVKRASLHNAAELNRLDLRTNDTVYIEKSGEIIPKITGVNITKRLSNSKKYLFITHCPACNTLLSLSDSQAFFYCPNIYGCKPQILSRIEHFSSRDAMDIEGLSTETIKLLYNKKLISDIYDIYALKCHVTELQKLKGWGDKSVNKLLSAIEASKTKGLHNFIYAIGIPGVGKTMAINLANHFKDIQKLILASADDLTSISGIGETLSVEVTKFFQHDAIKTLVRNLQDCGLNTKEDQNQNLLTSNKLKDKTFVISGIFDNFTRSALAQLISSHGAKITSSVTKNTDYLLAGDSPGNTKIEKATALGIEIISLDNLNALLNNE